MNINLRSFHKYIIVYINNGANEKISGGCVSYIKSHFNIVIITGRLRTLFLLIRDEDTAALRPSDTHFNSAEKERNYVCKKCISVYPAKHVIAGIKDTPCRRSVIPWRSPETKLLLPGYVTVTNGKT